MNDEILGECCRCEKPVLESDSWKLSGSQEVCHEECYLNEK